MSFFSFISAFVSLVFVPYMEPSFLFSINILLFDILLVLHCPLNLSFCPPKFTFRQAQISFKTNSHMYVCIYVCVCIACTARERSILCVNLISKMLSFYYLILDELELKNACARRCTHTRTVCTQMHIYIYLMYACICIYFWAFVWSLDVNMGYFCQSLSPDYLRQHLTLNLKHQLDWTVWALSLRAPPLGAPNVLGLEAHTTPPR